MPTTSHYESEELLLEIHNNEVKSGLFTSIEHKYMSRFMKTVLWKSRSSQAFFFLQSRPYKNSEECHSFYFSHSYLSFFLTILLSSLFFFGEDFSGVILRSTYLSYLLKLAPEPCWRVTSPTYDFCFDATHVGNLPASVRRYSFRRTLGGQSGNISMDHQNQTAFSHYFYFLILH